VKKEPVQISDASKQMIAPPVYEIIADSMVAVSDSTSTLDQLDQYVVKRFFHSSSVIVYCSLENMLYKTGVSK